MAAESSSPEEFNSNQLCTDLYKRASDVIEKVGLIPNGGGLPPGVNNCGVGDNYEKYPVDPMSMLLLSHYMIGKAWIYHQNTSTVDKNDLLKSLHEKIKAVREPFIRDNDQYVMKVTP